MIRTEVGAFWDLRYSVEKRVSATRIPTTKRREVIREQVTKKSTYVGTVKKAIKSGRKLKKGGANKKGGNSSQSRKAESNETQVEKNGNGSNNSSNLGSNAEVRRGGSHAKVNEGEREILPNNGDDSNEQKKRDSLRLLKGISSFKKTPSLDGENQSLASIN